MFKFITTLVLTLASATALAAVDLNKADQATLETVKGIGPALSTKLLEERRKGSFKDWADVIERVGGVGTGSAARLSAAGLTVGDKAYTAPAASADGFTAKVPRKAADQATASASSQRTANAAAASAKRAERKPSEDGAVAASKNPRRSAKGQSQTVAPAAAATSPALR